MTSLFGRSLLIRWAVLSGLATCLFNCGGDDKGNGPVEPPAPPPSGLEAVNGVRYGGLMGANAVTPEPAFRVTDSAGDPVNNTTVSFEILAGDGTLTDTSLTTDTSGTVILGYSFSGSMATAEVRARVDTTDSVDITIRANTAIDSVGGQAQYILFDESYQAVLDWNGSPLATAEDPNCPAPKFWYLDYESTLGLVFIVSDVNTSGGPDSADPVRGCIFVDPYPHKTADSLGIGSHIDSVTAVYGAPIAITLDTQEPPPAWRYLYTQPYMLWWADTASDTILQFDLYEANPCSAPTAPGLSSDQDCGPDLPAVRVFGPDRTVSNSVR